MPDVAPRQCWENFYFGSTTYKLASSNFNNTEVKNMRFRSFFLPFTFIALHALANDASPNVKHNYQVCTAKFNF